MVFCFISIWSCFVYCLEGKKRAISQETDTHTHTHTHTPVYKNILILKKNKILLFPMLWFAKLMLVVKIQMLQCVSIISSSTLNMCYPNCNYSNIIYFRWNTKSMSLTKLYSLQENKVLASKPVFVNFNQSPSKKQCFCYCKDTGWCAKWIFCWWIYQRTCASKDRNNSCLNKCIITHINGS